MGEPLSSGERMPGHQVTTGLSSKADQIRALARAGYLRTEIAAQLGIRYQHVRQVLERSGIDLGRKQRTNTASPGIRPPAKGRSKPEAAIMNEPIPASRLIDSGFIRIGQWTSISDEAFELDCILPADAGVYAFVVAGIIRYIRGR